MGSMRLTSRGSFDHLFKFLGRASHGQFYDRLEELGQSGVDALASATPVDSGLTAESWNYRVTHRNGNYGITWFNTNVNEGEVIAILLQYGHGTGTGGYVAGTDYINPAIRPIFDDIANAVWEEVTK